MRHSAKVRPLSCGLTMRLLKRRVRHVPASDTPLISAEEARLIDDILSKAGFGASPVSRAGQVLEKGLEDEDHEWESDDEEE